MHNFNPADFVALSPAKAKAAALALFDEAHASPAPDWYGVALALHAVVNRAPGRRAKLETETAMSDSADAGEFVPWADYQPAGKGTAIARGRVSITFADGWTVTVGMLAGRSGKGRKPWSIAHAVRFAVICYEAAAIRRATGDDAALYHQRDGLSFPLNGLIDVPEIMSIISADSAETVEGDLVWSACEANGFTRESRAGAVAVPLALEPMRPGLASEIAAVRRDLAGKMGLMRSPMHDGARAAAARVEALLYPAPALDLHGYAADCEPEAIEIEPEAMEDHDADAPADDEPGLFCGDEVDALADAVDETPIEVDPRASLAPVDHFTMVEASEIVGASMPANRPGMAEIVSVIGRLDYLDAFSASLSPISHYDRFGLVEDALIAWPALVEPCAAVDGVMIEAGFPVSGDEIAVRAAGWIIGPHGKWINPAINDGASYCDTPRAFKNICEDYGLAMPLEPVEPVAAVTAPAEPVKPASKPRYSVGADGKWTLIS